MLKPVYIYITSKAAAAADIPPELNLPLLKQIAKLLLFSRKLVFHFWIMHVCNKSKEIVIHRSQLTPQDYFYLFCDSVLYARQSKITHKICLKNPKVNQNVLYPEAAACFMRLKTTS